LSLDKITIYLYKFYYDSNDEHNLLICFKYTNNINNASPITFIIIHNK